MNPSTFSDSSRQPLQWGSAAAIAIGLVIVVVAQALDGGSFSALLQGPAALIVFGGTCAATFVSYSPATVMDALRAAARTFRGSDDDLDV